MQIEETSKMTIGSSALSLSKYPQVICNSIISCNLACKYLGITIHCELSFQEHILCDGETPKTKWFDKQTSSLCSKEQPGKLLQVKYKSNHSIWYPYIWLL